MARKQGKEHWKRSLAKAVTYRILIIILDMVAVYAFTRSFTIAFWFMVISNVYTAIAYYFHERLWNRIKWGRR